MKFIFHIIIVTDIHWVWHVHMLAPVTYKSDLERLFTRRINHRPQEWLVLRERRDYTRKLWNELWPEEPFDPSPDVEEIEERICDYQPGFDYDIATAVQRQRLFFYQVSLPHYRNEAFLQTAKLRYKMYLHLKALHPLVFLVPCYDMDIFWHAHQAQPLIYEEETEAAVGHLLPHDDSVNDRSEGSKLCNAEEQTRILWKATFKQDFSRPGSMFRGDPPNGKLWPIPNCIHESLVRGVLYHVSLSAMQWTASSVKEAEKYSTIGDLSLKCTLHAKPLSHGGWEKRKSYLPSMEVKSLNGQVISFKKKAKQEAVTFTYIEGTNPSLEFEVENVREKTDCFCLKYNKTKSLASASDDTCIEKLLNIDCSSSNLLVKTSVDFKQRMSGRHRTQLKVKKSSLTTVKYNVFAAALTQKRGKMSDFKQK